MSEQVAAGQLRSFVERIERLEDEIRELNESKSDIYKEVRSFGYDVKTVRKVVAKRRKDPTAREEEDTLFDMYWNALHNSETGTPRATRARTISQSQQPSSPLVAAEPEAIPPTVASGSSFTVQVKTARDYRPHCQSPDACASFSLDHCHTCKKAILAEEAA